jgi:hypothetical protein
MWERIKNKIFKPKDEAVATMVIGAFINEETGAELLTVYVEYGERSFLFIEDKVAAIGILDQGEYKSYDLSGEIPPAPLADRFPVG